MIPREIFRRWRGSYFLWGRTKPCIKKKSFCTVMKFVSFLFKGYSQTTGAPVYCSQVERTTVSGGSSSRSCGLSSSKSLTSWKLDLNSTFFVNSIVVEAVSNDSGSPQIAHVIHYTRNIHHTHFLFLSLDTCFRMKSLCLTKTSACMFSFKMF